MPIHWQQWQNYLKHGILDKQNLPSEDVLAGVSKCASLLCLNSFWVSASMVSIISLSSGFWEWIGDCCGILLSSDSLFSIISCTPLVEVEAVSAFIGSMVDGVLLPESLSAVTAAEFEGSVWTDVELFEEFPKTRFKKLSL